MKKHISSAFLVTIASLCLSAKLHAAILLNVDLSVENQITISATDGKSLATVSGTDGIGVYLDGFFNTSESASIGDQLLVGDLTFANNPSDNSPNLFRGNSTDPGLNIFSVTNLDSINVVIDTLVFIGQATWDINPIAYQQALLGSLGGDLYFPADTIDDLDTAAIIGEWAVVGIPQTQVSAPSLIILLFAGAFALFFRKSQTV